MTNLDNILCEARRCSGLIGERYASSLTYGESTPEQKFDLFRLNAYIRTLSRNREIVQRKKVEVPVTSVSMSSLEKHGSYLSLRNGSRIVCKETRIPPCLTQLEINEIVEQIKLICQGCGCDCK